MSTLTIAIPDNELTRINEKANRLGVTTEELLQLSLKVLISQHDTHFKHTLHYVLQKNAELYKRLV